MEKALCREGYAYVLFAGASVGVHGTQAVLLRATNGKYVDIAWGSTSHGALKASDLPSDVDAHQIARVFPKRPSCSMAADRIFFVPPDLRQHQCDDVLIRAQRTLDTKFDPATEVRKRRSIGLRTDRDTWVRIEIRDLARIDGQNWGQECAAVLQGVSMPKWYQGATWLDDERGVIWRADETEFVSERVVIPAGFLTTEPSLPESWWETFNASLTALANHAATRTATPGLRPITQARFTETIQATFPEVDATITEWAAAHADLGWPNLTAPACYFLDWEDWGLAPRGYDAGTLRIESLAVPALAERIYRERQSDLDSRTGQLAQLYQCAKLMSAPAGRSGPLLEPAKTLAAELLSHLRA